LDLAKERKALPGWRANSPLITPGQPVDVGPLPGGVSLLKAASQHFEKDHFDDVDPVPQNGVSLFSSRIATHPGGLALPVGYS